MNEPILCYVDLPWCYFTTQELSKQWGDDWNDAPYEHNAGTPYEPCWHNEPDRMMDDRAGIKPGQLCRCKTCERDWNFYETENGVAYAVPKWQIIKVAADTDMIMPEDDCGPNSRYSVQRINAGAVAWLRSHRWHANHPIVIPAGTTLTRFKQLIQETGGQVYDSHQSNGQRCNT